MTQLVESRVEELLDGPHQGVLSVSSDKDRGEENAGEWPSGGASPEIQVAILQPENPPGYGFRESLDDWRSSRDRPVFSVRIGLRWE